jgi:hypothetical protein
MPTLKRWSASASAWEYVNNATNALGQLIDVSVSGASDNDFLRYDSDTQTWVNDNVIDGGNSVSAIATIQLRRDSSDNWVASNPTLSAGEMGFELDTNRFKFGDGSKTWNQLDYRKTHIAAGCTITNPSITAINQPTGLQIATNDITAVLYDNANFDGMPYAHSVSGTTLSVIDNAVNYLVVRHAASGSYYDVTTNVNEINESNVIPINTMLVTDGWLHFSHWDRISDGTVNKLHRRFVKTQRYARESGLELTVNGSVTHCASGVVWRGARAFDLPAVYSDGTNDSSWFLYTQNATGGWIGTFGAPGYNSTHYNTPSGTATLNPNKWNINWIFRGVEDHNHGYYILSNDEYKDEPTAIAETKVPAIPIEISSHAILVGRILCKNSSPVLTTVENAFDYTFTGAVINEHNQLAGLDGGYPVSGEYYHLSKTLYNEVASASTTLSNSLANYVPSTRKINNVPLSADLTTADLLPSQGTANGKYLTSNGTSASWVNPNTIQDLGTKDTNYTCDFNQGLFAKVTVGTGVATVTLTSWASSAVSVAGWLYVTQPATARTQTLATANVIGAGAYVASLPNSGPGCIDAYQFTWTGTKWMITNMLFDVKTVM